jgi:hypothetical protein
MKNFVNISIQKIAALLGLKIEGRRNPLILKAESPQHYLCVHIQLYLLLHFFANANDGVTGMLNLDQLAQLTHRTVKTIIDALKRLQAGNLVSILEHPQKGYVIVQIVGVQDMYMRRGAGGQGYIVCSKDTINTILSCKTINPLRTTLMALLQFNLGSVSSADVNIDAKISLKDLSKCFPQSARPVDIRRACDDEGLFGQMLKRTETDLKQSLGVQVRPQYNDKKKKRQRKIEAATKITMEIKTLNDIIKTTNTTIAESGHLPISAIPDFKSHKIEILDYIGISHNYNLPTLDNCFTQRVISDCAIIAQDYDVDVVIDAIRIFYAQYLLSGDFAPKDDTLLGGIIRNIVHMLDV